MPKHTGVYRAANGSWYFKATVGADRITGKRVQVTKRGYPTAADAALARKQVLDGVGTGDFAVVSGSLTVDEQLDLYLDGIDADQRLAPKPRHDYRSHADAYVRPLLGSCKVRDLGPETVLAWQRDLASGVGTARGKALSPNTVRLARASLAGAVKMAVQSGMLSTNPLAAVPRPKPRRSTPQHWSPGRARQFLALQDGDRLYPVWAFLLGSGLRIGELVWLRWDNVDLERRQVRVVEFAHHARLRARGVRRQERHVPPNGRPGRWAGEGPAASARAAAVRGPAHESREEPVRLHPSRRGLLPPTGGLQATRRVLGRRRVAPPDGARPSTHERHADARHGRPCQGRCRAPRPRRPGPLPGLYSHVTPTMQRGAADAIGNALFGPPAVGAS